MLDNRVEQIQDDSSGKLINCKCDEFSPISSHPIKNGRGGVLSQMIIIYFNSILNIREGTGV